MKALPLSAIAATLGLIAVPAQAQFDTMAKGVNGWTVADPLHTNGETIAGTTGALNPSTAGNYTPVGILDGLGAYRLDSSTVRVFANHELLNFRGNSYQVSDGQGGTFSMTGARISYFDIDRRSRQIVDAGLAYNKIYDGNGKVATDTSFLLQGFGGFSRFCSSALFEKGEYGLVDTIYFAGEEDGGFFNPVGGAEWALDVGTGDLWQVPALGRGAWENVTMVDTGNRFTIGMILADDSSPFDFDGDGIDEAAPLYFYLGFKIPGGNFLQRNGLAFGLLYVWRSNTGERTPLEFNGSGSLDGRWVLIDNFRRPGLASETGTTGYDEYGYPTQGNLWLQARDRGAFGFSRPEDVSTNPRRGNEVVLASTGVDTYAVDPVTGNGADTFGTMYTVKTWFSSGRRRGNWFFHLPSLFFGFGTKLTIIYDGDADSSRALRSPDNLDWADDGWIYVQEDEAEESTLTGEPLFGLGAANPNEAGIVRMRKNGVVQRIANIDRSVILDPTIAIPTNAVDVDAGNAGEWETSGILDVSAPFGERRGTLFIFNVQAHGIEDQDQFNPTSRIVDGDLVEGGQLLFLER